MSSAQDPARRTARLRGLFRDTIEAKRVVSNSKEAQLFLEAVRSHDSASHCIEILVSSQRGLDAVRKAVRSDLSAPFILSNTLPFLRYLADPGVKALADGQLLERVLLAVVDPPTTLQALIDLFKARQIPDENLHPFAWLALELLLLPPNAGVDAGAIVEAISDGQLFLKSQDHGTRELGYKIQKVVKFRASSGQCEELYGPGGRHDNDFADFRRVRIFPTTDEFLSEQIPYYQTANEIKDTDIDKRPAAHLGNQFRLLREDMLAELREDIQMATGKKKGRRPAMILGHLVPVGIDIENDRTGKYKRCTLQLKCFSGLQFLQKNFKEVEQRKTYLLKDQPGLLKHQAFGVLYKDKNIYGFAFVDRDVDNLAKSPPVVSLQFTDDVGLRNALRALALPTREMVHFVLVDTPVFAYEPVLLGLQRINDLPLLDALVNPTSISDLDFEIPKKLQPLVATLRSSTKNLGLDGVVQLTAAPHKVDVDESQLSAVLRAFTTAVCLIQGPPGTGKSFIGAQIARLLFDSGLRILVLSYTNHALDQFLGDLLKAGIPAESMYRRSQGARNIIIELQREAGVVGDRLRKAFQTLINFSPKWDDISEYLEFADGGDQFLDAFKVPTDGSGWSRANKRGKKVGPDYLYLQWINGQGPAQFAHELPKSAMPVWQMSRASRNEKHHAWVMALIEEHLQTVQDLSRNFNQIQEKIVIQYGEADAHIMAEKKIIGCTTTGAAKYHRLIRLAATDVVLIEEAGEIPESHVLTALTSKTKQIVLIGDHKQLRPKINNHALSVEKGDGFDLNRSIFERLIIGGAEFATLHKQHRMAPEISMFARELTYPKLLDGPKTNNRALILGLQNRVIFLNHGRYEDSDKQLQDCSDQGMKESKKNLFEAEMVLRCVKYLGQQGYSSDKIVVLTPYLGQLRLLRDLMHKNQHDPELCEMDKNQLLKAGLMSMAAANLDKTPLRISTIDNYQGEENDIVIASLTRSNDSGQIGFMDAPERLNVLITRARNSIILIGNMDTFMKSKKGKSTWHPFFDLLKKKEQLYDGLPVKCQKHPERTALLKVPEDFDKLCPDGGCTVPWKNYGCQKCIQEDKDMERRIKRDLKLEENRRCREQEYARNLQEIQDEIEHQRRINKYKAEKEERKNTLEQHRFELAALKVVETRLQQQNQAKSEAAKVAQEAKAEGASNLKSTSLSRDQDWSSSAMAEWESMKKHENAQSNPLDNLMEMIGLEEVKQEFLNVKSKVDTALRQGISMVSERYSCSMLGNPGTGKTTVARLYAQFLTELCVIPGCCFKEATGAKLANIGVTGCTKLIDEILNEGGGVLFIDEAYQLTSGNNLGGGAVLDYLLAEVENLRGKLVFVIAGYNKQMESFYARNPGLPSRFPVEMKFADYTDEELLEILELKVKKKYNSAMRCEDGLAGLYCRIVTRRVGRGRGKECFGNARSVENMLDKISRRQANRLRRERKKGTKPDDFFFTKEDLIGPEPSDALAKCEAWKKLQTLTGLGAVKEAVKSLVDSMMQNYLRELAEGPLIQYSLNKVFLGNPGTGKTTVAKLYGEILVALGMLSKGEVVVKNPSDFVGAHLGQSEQQTKGILAAALGKVLVIDEAYSLYGGGGSHGSILDPYKAAVIDTIVAEVQSVPGDDRCVLLLGYKDQMEDMFQNVNPGLSRRFPIASGFNFEDFSNEELCKIFDLKVKEQGYQATAQGVKVAMEMLKRARNRPNFGNAGEIDILLDAAKARHQARFTKGEAKSAAVLEAQDFDEDFDRAERSETNVRKLFEGTVGSKQIIALLEGYQETVRIMKALEVNPKDNIPFNFLFRGPPGTGKTTTAKKMGKVFYDMGFLASAEVIECSASDLVGQFVGQTGPKVQQLFNKALGKVLFVDEAYRLAEGHFAKEAMDEIVDSVTKDRYFKKLVIILAGYEADINRLMSVNPGLTSRFPEVINFQALTAEECVALLLSLLQRQKTSLESKSNKVLDLFCLEQPTTEFWDTLLRMFADLAAQDNWASARDVLGVAKRVFNKAIRDKEGLAKGCLTLNENVIIQELDGMLQERAARATPSKSASHFNPQNGLTQEFGSPRQAPPPLKPSTAAATSQGQAPPPLKEKEPPAENTKLKPEPYKRRPYPGKRDAGVSDEIWEQLQRDWEAQEVQEEEYHQLKQAAQTAKDAAREKIVKRLLEKEEKMKKEEEIRKRLEIMGKCPMGFQWIKQGGGGGARGFAFDGEKELGL
ncbi:hypothetical protein N0V88_007010 [Collariella sp. IMI 366227]|nr:hypothetical protein N0V88_007010 [Collariella sp. IMI 366227]